MQLYALNEAVPVATSKAERGKNYLCPECGCAVRLRGGPSRQPHFYHLSLPKKCRQHQKSPEHLQLQLKLCDLIGPEAQMECPFPAIQRIADVAWHSKKVVFEVQCSSLPLEEAESRTLDYAKAGYQVIWILHDRQFNKSNLSAAENYLRTNLCYFTNFDKRGSGIVYDQFEVLAKHRRLFKGPPLSLSPTQLFSIPAISSPDIALPRQILERLMQWKYYAQGDLLHRLLKQGQLSHPAKKMIALESRYNNRSKPQMLPLKALIAKCYGALIDWALRGQSCGL